MGSFQPPCWWNSVNTVRFSLLAASSLDHFVVTTLFSDTTSLDLMESMGIDSSYSSAMDLQTQGMCTRFQTWPAFYAMLDCYWTHLIPGMVDGTLRTTLQITKIKIPCPYLSPSVRPSGTHITSIYAAVPLFYIDRETRSRVGQRSASDFSLNARRAFVPMVSSKAGTVGQGRIRCLIDVHACLRRLHIQASPASADPPAADPPPRVPALKA